MTGYGHYIPPEELNIPKNHYFNPYVRGMITNLKPFLSDKMLEYDDGVQASTPQMAYDLANFMAFMKYGYMPDMKVQFATYFFLINLIEI